MRRIKTTQIITIETSNINQTKINNPPQQNSRNRYVASAMNKGQQENIDLLKLCGRVHEDFIQLWIKNN